MGTNNSANSEEVKRLCAQLLKEEDQWDRKEIIRKLHKIGSPEAIKGLTSLLSKPMYKQDKWEAAFLLGSMGVAEAAKTLINLLIDTAESEAEWKKRGSPIGEEIEPTDNISADISLALLNSLVTLLEKNPEEVPFEVVERACYLGLSDKVFYRKQTEAEDMLWPRLEMFVPLDCSRIRDLASQELKRRTRRDNNS